jgi:hypothetical protein
MRLRAHPSSYPPIDREHGQYIVGVLSLLIDIVGPSTLLATLLRQTSNEIESLLPGDEDVPEERVA